MQTRLRRARRAEGLSEYTVLLTIVMVCSVAGLISASSRAMRQIAADKNLCKIEGKDCAGVEDEVRDDDTTTEGEEGSEGSEGEEGSEGTEGEDGTGPDGADETDSGPENGGPEGSDGPDSSSPSSSDSEISRWDSFWGPLASNPMIMGFSGMMSWFF